MDILLQVVVQYPEFEVLNKDLFSHSFLETFHDLSRNERREGSEIRINGSRVQIDIMHPRAGVADGSESAQERRHTSSSVAICDLSWFDLRGESS